MSKQIEALKLALAGLVKASRYGFGEFEEEKSAISSAIQHLEMAEQPAQQEPVSALGYMNAGHVHEMQQGRLSYGYVYPKRVVGASVPLYTAPQPSKQLKGLTDAQIGAVAADIWGSILIAPQSYQAFARAIEAKLKEKNHG